MLERPPKYLAPLPEHLRPKKAAPHFDDKKRKALLQKLEKEQEKEREHREKEQEKEREQREKEAGKEREAEAKREKKEKKGDKAAAIAALSSKLNQLHTQLVLCGWLASL